MSETERRNTAPSGRTSQGLAARPGTPSSQEPARAGRETLGGISSALSVNYASEIFAPCWDRFTWVRALTSLNRIRNKGTRRACSHPLRRLIC